MKRSNFVVFCGPILKCKRQSACGPDPMIEAISKDLQKIGVDKEKIVIEEF